MNFQKASIGLWSMLILVLSIGVAQAGFIGDLADKATNAVKSAEDKLTDKVGFCVLNSHCNTAFFKLDNYCCSVTCCSWYSYVTRNDNKWKNFVETVEDPRAINIILAVLGVLVISALISALSSLICCFFGCSSCCGSKKYSIVRH